MTRPWWTHPWIVLDWLDSKAGFYRRNWWQELLHAFVKLCCIIGGVCRGAHMVEKDQTSNNHPDLDRSYIANRVCIVFEGWCPVQGYGVVDAHPCYYRSRGMGWQFHVAALGGKPLEDDVFVYSETPYFRYDGGWVSPLVSKRCIERAVAAWRAWKEEQDSCCELDWNERKRRHAGLPRCR